MMNISEQKIETGFKSKGDYDKTWYGLVEDIVDLDDQLYMEQASGDFDALASIDKLQRELESKRNLLKRLDTEGFCI